MAQEAQYNLAMQVLADFLLMPLSQCQRVLADVRWRRVICHAIGIGMGTYCDEPGRNVGANRNSVIR